MDAPIGDPLPRQGSDFVLRRLSADDLAAFQAYRHDPELGRYQGWSATPDPEARAFLEEMHDAPFLSTGTWIQIGIAEPTGRRLIGDIGLFLDPDGREAEIGFTLAREFQGRGLATAAVCEVIRLVFECSNAERVRGITDARNAASARLLERVGMARIDTTHGIFRGEPCIEYIYAMARGGR